MQCDHHMGQLFTALKENGIDENTLVVFTTDNGCSPEGNFKVLKEHGHDPSGGFRGHKADLYEGGHRVPFIVRWPKGIKAGQKTDALACQTDLYPTMEAITGQTRQDVGGEDGYSLVPVFNGESKTTGRTTVISHSISGHFAIREGDWKLCLAAGSGGWSAPREKDAQRQGLPSMQLFNLAEYKAEQKNLIKTHPERAQALLKILQTEVDNGRCTPGTKIPNDREITFLPKGVTIE